MKQLMRKSIALALMALATVAQADLNRVGPTLLPSPPQNGFPAWYQDLNGLVLDQCLPDAVDPGALQQTACLLLPLGPGIPPLPYVFPTNYPAELFFNRAVSNIATNAAKRAVLVLALEGSYTGGAPAAGQQIVFTRIRITAGVPFDGDYTVTHPYGSEFFPNVVAGVGNRDISFTEDVGIGAPGVFTGALTSRFGPFLQGSATPGGLASAPVTLNGAQFLGDGVALSNVTGSPFGTNYFEICGPLDGPGTARCIREPLFALTGRLHNFVTAPIGSPLTINAATYARNAAGTAAQVDVSANAIPGIGQAPAKLTAAAPNVSPVLMRGPSTPALGDFYAQGIPLPNPPEIPAVITVTNSGDAPPTSVTKAIVDQVSIAQATWDPVASSLTVIATSSDKFATIVPPATVGATPALRVDGFPVQSFVAGGITGDPASVTITVPNVLIPPPSLTVSSSKGGQGFSTVLMGVAPAFPCGVPFAQDDAATTIQSVAVVIPVLANDTTGALCALTGVPVILAPGPTFGTATVDPLTGAVTFTSGLTGTATFKYTLADAVGTSNVATVTVTVNANPAGPVPTAVADGPFSVAANGTLAIPATTLTANDLANGGVLDPASIQIVAGSVTGGTATVGAGGNVTYVAGATPGSFSFQYTVANTVATGGQRSAPATVSITVTAANDVLTVASARFRTGIRRWDVAGTSTVSAGNIVTVTLFRGATAIGVVGTAPVVAGAWTLSVTGSNVIAQNGDRVVATSTANGTAQLPVQVRQ